MTSFLRRYFAGGGTSTVLVTAMGSSDTSFTISSATGWPGTPGNNFIVVVDRGTSSEEKILCSQNSGTTVTVASSGRGYDGTSATAHNQSATVSLCGGAVDFDEANQVAHLLGNGAEGTLFYGKGTGALPAALPVGADGALLYSNGTDPAWLAIGTSGQVLQVSGGVPAWTTFSASGGLIPTSKSSNYTAASGDLVNATATLTVTSPAAASGARFGAIANYAASNGSPVTITAASGYLIGPGIPASTSSILLGAIGANISFVSDGTNWYQTSGAQDSGWITPTLLNSWATYSVAPAYRLIGNRVVMRGSMNGGASNAIPFTLPVGMRPAYSTNFGSLCVASSAFTETWANIINGSIYPVFVGGSFLYVTFDGVTFTVD